MRTYKKCASRIPFDKQSCHVIRTIDFKLIENEYQVFSKSRTSIDREAAPLSPKLPCFPRRITFLGDHLRFSPNASFEDNKKKKKRKKRQEEILTVFAWKMLPFLFFFCYVYRNLLPLIEILNDLSKNISPFSFHSVLKKVSIILKLRFVSRKICSTRNGERSFRTKESASLIFSFLNVIILCALIAYIRSSFALHLPTAAA